MSSPTQDADEDQNVIATASGLFTSAGGVLRSAETGNSVLIVFLPVYFFRMRRVVMLSICIDGYVSYIYILFSVVSLHDASVVWLLWTCDGCKSPSFMDV